VRQPNDPEAVYQTGQTNPLSGRSVRPLSQRLSYHNEENAAAPLRGTDRSATGYKNQAETATIGNCVAGDC
jgi:hypothetical protein